jgi:Transposase DDE domain group 1
VKRRICEKLRKHQRRVEAHVRRRRERRQLKTRSYGEPVIATRSRTYDLSERSRGISCGGVPLLLRMAQRIGLVDAIDRRVKVLKLWLPYRESDHVLNFAINAWCDGQRLEDMELRRNDFAFLEAIGAETLPDPTTEGDFCRRFTESSIRALQDAIDEARLNVWQQQPASFFEEAIIEMDGTMVVTTGSCKHGMDINYQGKWGYHPLVVTLANTRELLSIVNRSGNKTSHDGAAAEADRAIALCRLGGFRKVRLRGDTDFSLTTNFDRWNADNVVFEFGYDASATMKAHAEGLEKRAWKKLARPLRYEVETVSRKRPDNIKREIVRQREYLCKELKSEQVAEFKYKPVACQETYRVVVVRKNISEEKGDKVLFDKIRYFFYITNDWDKPAADVVFSCNDRCDQENILAQLSGGVRALSAPVDNLYSNWAYMVMTGIAWTMKSWMALLLPVRKQSEGEHNEERQTLLTMEFRTFLNAFIRMPCQIVHQARRVILRVLAYNPHLPTFFRLCHVLRI